MSDYVRITDRKIEMTEEGVEALMSDYTPTTEEVSIGWAWYKSGWIHSDEIQPQFDRWLAEVKAQAWEEGHSQPWELGEGGYALKAVNPYRQGETE